MNNKKLQKLVIKPTLNCICNCPYCSVRQEFYKQQEQHKRQLNIRKIKEVFNEAKNLGAERLLISGGEPLIYNDLLKIIKEGKKYNWFVFINSVGYGVDEKLAGNLIKAGLSAFNVSIDSPRPEIHNKSRGVNGLLEEALNTLNIFAKLRKSNSRYKNFYTNIQTIIMRETYQDLPCLIELAFDLEVSSVYLMYIYNDKDNKFSLSRDQIIDFKENIVPAIISIFQKRKIGKDIIKNAQQVLVSLFDTTHNNLENYTISKYWNDLGYIKSICNQPDKTAMVLANGNVLPCCTIENEYVEVMGNIFEQNLTDIWHGEKYKLFRKEKSKFCQFCPSLINKTLGLVPSMLRQF